MVTEADKLISEFLQDLAKVHENLAGLGFSQADAMSGLAAQGVGEADLGAMSLSNVIAYGHIVGQIAATYGIVAAFFLTPVGLVPVVLGVLLANTGIRHLAKDWMEKEVRKQLSGAISQKVRAEASANASKAAGEIGTTIGAATSELMSRVANELTQLQAQADNTIATLSQDDAGVQRRRDLLTEWDAVLEKAADEVEDLISDLALT